MHHLSSSVALHVLKNQDLPFSKPEFPLLKDHCLEIFVENFEEYPTLEGIDSMDKERIYKNLDTKLYETIPKDPESLQMKYRIDMLTAHINYEPFWKDICKQHFKILLKNQYSPDYKSVYLSKYFQKYAEQLSLPQGADEEQEEEQNNEFMAVVQALKDHIYKLQVLELRRDLDLYFLFANFNKLRALHLCLGRKKAGRDFENLLVGMKLSDMHVIASVILNLPDLEELNLAGNMLEDVHLSLLTKQLETHPKLKILNLGHNKISNEGARCVSRLLQKNKVIEEVDLSNNQIGYEGARCLSLSLQENNTLQKLSLKLNYLSDQSAVKFCQDIAQNTSLRILDLSANLFTDNGAQAFMDLINNNMCGLFELYLSSNKFSELSFETFKNGLSRNSTLQVFTISRTDMSKKNQIILEEITTKKYMEKNHYTFISKKQLEESKKLEEKQRAEANKQAENSTSENGDGEEGKVVQEEQGGEGEQGQDPNQQLSLQLQQVTNNKKLLNLLSEVSKNNPFRIIKAIPDK